METNAEYEISLNHLTASEYLTRKESFEEYKTMVLRMLYCYDKFQFEDDLIEKLKTEEVLQINTKGKQITMEDIQTSFPDRYFYTGGHRRKNKTDEHFTKVWFDIWGDEYIAPSDEIFYDVFLTYKLRSLDLIKIDSFLDYQLAKWHDNNADKFIRFLQLTLRKHGEKLLSPEYILTVNEWMDKQKKTAQLGVVETKPEKPKEKLIRERRDKATKLTSDQTALLAYFLSKAGIILPIGKQYHEIDNAEIGKALAMLTRFNADNLRQSLSDKQINTIADKKNLDALQNALQQAINKIEDRRRELKESKKSS